MQSLRQILTQNGHIHVRSFKVIYFDVIEKPLSDYILQYYGIVCEGSEDIVSERSENRHFQRPYCYPTPPLQQTPANIRIIFIWLETRIPGLHSYFWHYGSPVVRIFVVGSENMYAMWKRA